MTTVLDTALSLAGNGWPCFPCKPNAKTPAVEHGLKDASTDPDMIRLWWTWWPDANVAIATGQPGPDVLDIDTKTAADGMASLAQLDRAGLAEGYLGVVRTPSGGLHRYYRGTNQRNGSIARRGVDFRSAGGYVLAPPSIVDGRPYEVVEWRVGARGRALDWSRVKALLDPPRRISPQTAPPGGDVTALARWLARQPEGGRNNAAYWAACRCVESGHGTELDVIVAAAVESGLPEQEAHKTVMSAARRLGAA